MFRVCLFTLLFLSMFLPALPGRVSAHDAVGAGAYEAPGLAGIDAPGQELLRRPAWARNSWSTLLFLALVIAFIFGGAYGIHLYQMRNLNKQTDRLEHVVSLRTEEVRRMNAAHQEVINALVATNDALLDTNALLESANDKLAWTNNQLKHSNRKLELRTAELDFALEQNKEIMQVTVHDMKNPLGGIVGLTEMVQEELARRESYEGTYEIRDNLGLIHQAAQHMLLNVKALLDRHRHRGDGPLQREVVYINDIIITTLQWNRHQANKKHLKVYFSGRHDRAAVYVDVSAMRRVLDNLISNAIKYSSMHGKIWIELLQQEGEVWVSVRDQGPGLTDEDVERVFGKNAQLSAKPTAGEHSSGYGLYIVKQLVEQHGGKVGVESALGEGAVFWFKVDAAEAPAPEQQKMAAASSYAVDK